MNVSRDDEQKNWLRRIGMNEAEFVRLQKKWYKRLAKDGFEDAEDAGPYRFLKDWHGTNFTHIDPVVKQASEEYWEDAFAFLNTHRFSRPIEKTIWRLHCQGLTKREIAQKIEKRPDALKATAVLEVLWKLKKQMRE
jgi:hypothetical protein